MNTRALQQEAEMAYKRLPSEDAVPYLQAALLAEIALQLEKHTEQIDKQNSLLLRLCIAVEALEPGT